MADVEKFTAQLHTQATAQGDANASQNATTTNGQGDDDDAVTFTLLEDSSSSNPTAAANVPARAVTANDSQETGEGELTMMETSSVGDGSTLDASTVLADGGATVTDENGQNKSPAAEEKKVIVKTPGKWAKYKKRYSAKWESEPGLMEWIRRVPDDETKVLCRFCRSIHRAHRYELRKHANSNKHKAQSAYVVLPDDCSPIPTSKARKRKNESHAPRIFKSMRVVRVTTWGNSDVLEVFNDVSMPEPEDNQVLIKVGAAGINPVDAYIRSGQYANLPSLPWTPGLDCAGTVEHVGYSVTKFRSGDRVYTNGSLTGTYAEYTLCNEENVFLLPDQLDFKGGAALGIPYFTAYRALVQRARARPGQTVLIHGASGSVGMAAVQFARAYGMVVMGTAGTDEGMTLVRDFGAHFVFNHRQEDYTDQILTATEGDGVDVIIEMLANINLQKDLEMLAMGGMVAVVGNRGVVEINPRLLMPKECGIIGVMLHRSTKKERKEAATAVKAGIEAGWIRPHIGMAFPLEAAPAAHEELMAGRGAQGRLVLVL